MMHDRGLPCSGTIQSLALLLHCFSRTCPCISHCGADTAADTEWASWNGTTLRPIWGDLVGTELYLHDAGNATACNQHENACFDQYENKNLATDPQWANEAAALSAQLHRIVASQY